MNEEAPNKKVYIIDALFDDWCTKGEIMRKTGGYKVSRKGKRTLIDPVYWIVVLMLGSMMLLCHGCASYAQPGESAAETSRRHHRAIRANYSQMIEDIDKFLMLDKPSSLSDKRLPR